MNSLTILLIIGGILGYFLIGIILSIFALLIDMKIRKVIIGTKDIEGYAQLCPVWPLAIIMGIIFGIINFVKFILEKIYLKF